MLTKETFYQNWIKAFPGISLQSTPFFIAISGGVDSVVLAHLMHSLNASLTLVHANFQLRGLESKRDQDFVTNYASKLNLPLQVQAFDTNQYAQVYQMGIQEAAREIRYAWFSRLLEEAKENAKEKTQPFLLTAHHADDQVETVLMQLARGTGLHGLTGIPSKRTDNVHVLRPLLVFSKEEIVAYAQANDLFYVEDSSNQKADYTRNLIRLDILPKLQKVFPQVSLNIVQTIERLKESEQIVNETIDAFWKLGRKKYKGIDCIKIVHWLKVAHLESYTWGLIKPLGFKAQQINEVHKLLNAQTGAYILSDSHKLVKYKELIQIVPLSTQLEHQLIYGEGVLKTSHFNLAIQLLSRNELETIPNDKSIVLIDADKIEWPLLLRSWQPTDYFYPFGTQKKKKLNQFLAAAQLSPVEKEKMTVISTGDRIVWVVGQRMDNRFRITDTTKSVLKLSIQ